jgi:hypothetical protein
MRHKRWVGKCWLPGTRNRESPSYTWQIGNFAFMMVSRAVSAEFPALVARPARVRGYCSFGQAEKSDGGQLNFVRHSRMLPSCLPGRAS